MNRKRNRPCSKHGRPARGRAGGDAIYHRNPTPARPTNATPWRVTADHLLALASLASVRAAAGGPLAWKHRRLSIALLADVHRFSMTAAWAALAAGRLA